MNIWLDDIRDPKVVAPGGLMDREDASWREVEPERDWIWVKNKNELEELLKSTEGRIEIMSFDHDLGDWAEDGTELTGRYIIEWLQREYLDRYPKVVLCHSANPIGKDNILAFDANVRKHLLKE